MKVFHRLQKLKLDVRHGIYHDKYVHVYDLSDFDSYKRGISTLEQEKQEDSQNDPGIDFGAGSDYSRGLCYLLSNTSIILKRLVFGVNSEDVTASIRNRARRESYRDIDGSLIQ